MKPVIFACLLVVFAAGTACAQETPSEEKSDWQTRMKALIEEAKTQSQNIDTEEMMSAARADLQGIGDWEYRVEALSGDLEAQQALLNEWGTERWDVIWIKGDGKKMTVYMKRPVRTLTERALNLREMVAQ